MRKSALCRLFSLVVIIGLLVGVSAVAVWAQTEGSSPSEVAVLAGVESPTSQPVKSPREKAIQLTTTGIDEALAGKFDPALIRLREAGSSLDYQPAAEATKLLEEYLDMRKETEAGRAEEYAQAVQRVRRSLIAQAYRPTLVAAGLLADVSDKDEDEDKDKDKDQPSTAPASQPAKDDEKNLRQRIVAAIEAYSEVGPEALAAASADEATEIKANAVKGVADARKALAKAQKMLDGDASRYAGIFAEQSRIAAKRLDEYGQGWVAADISDLQHCKESAQKIKKIESELNRAMGDVETLVMARPWVVGLVQGRLAKELAVDGETVAEMDWYRKIKTLAEAEGQKATANAKWYQALSAYAGLSDLEPNSNLYKKKLKSIRRHIRVLDLYGRTDHQDDETDAEDNGTWKDYVAGVDGKMVKEIISEMAQYYVTDVKYKDVAQSAIDGVRILIETPQAVKSFPKLGDAAAKAKFMATLDAESEAIETDGRVDHLDIQYALNRVLRASESTVEIPLDVLAVEFAEGMLDELDRFSSMFWPYDLNESRKLITGKFYGVGIQITKERLKPLKVVSPLLGSPAYKQDIKPDDLILAVDGKRTERLSLEKLVRMITGDKGTKVVLTIKRPGDTKPKDYSIIRDEIRVNTVKGWRRLPSGDWDYMIDPVNKIGYIRVTQFVGTTASRTGEVLEELRGQGVRSVILDMRFNPGGLLTAAARLSDEFLASGTVVSTDGRASRAQSVRASARGSYQDGHLVVLVNRYSASASEIVSGAIKDWQRGTIVGERTFGKGSVQNVINIASKRASLKLTTAYFYLPSGRLLHRKNGSATWGVDPDVEVKVTPRQMKRWLDLRQKTDIVQEVDPQKLSGQLDEQLQADIQLNTAVMLLKLMQLQQSRIAA